MITPNGDQHDACVRNFSLGGVRVDRPNGWSPSEGTALKLFFMMESEQTMMVQGQVVRVAVDHFGLAFEPGQEECIAHVLSWVRGS